MLNYSSRPWIERAIANWITAREQPRVMAIVGGPGTGKSRMLSALVGGRDPGRVLAGAELGCALLRDPASRFDEFLTSTVQDALRGLRVTSGTAAAPPEVSIVANQVISGSDRTTGVNVAVRVGDELQDFRRNVLPQLAQLPPGPPVLVVVDGLDEAARDRAESVLEMLGMLADSIHRAPDSGEGIGRLRLLVASQPELPLRVSAGTDVATVNLDGGDPEDEENLREHVLAQLARLESELVQEVAAEIVRRAERVWAWADLAVRGVLEDAAAGLPLRVTTPSGLSAMYGDTLQRIHARHPSETESCNQVLTVAAAGFDAGTTATAPLLADTLGLSRQRVRAVLTILAPLCVVTGDTVRFRYSDVGRWLIDGLYPTVDVRDGHDMLVAAHRRQAAHGWTGDDGLAARSVLPHALARVEYAVGTPQFAQARADFCELLLDAARIHQDRDRSWLHWLERAGDFVGDSCVLVVPGHEPVDVLPLTATLFEIMAPIVGMRLAEPMDDAALDEFDALLNADDHDGATEWLTANAPRYVDVVRDEATKMFDALYSGWLPDPPDVVATRRAAWLRGQDALRRWRRTSDRPAAGLDAAVDAFEEALQLTSDEHWSERTDCLIALANALTHRVRLDPAAAADLDRLIEVQRELADRLTTSDRSVALGRLGVLLRDRWQRDPGGQATSLDEAIEACEEAVALASPTARLYRLIEMANTLGHRVDVESRRDDLDRLIDLLADLLAYPDLSDRCTVLSLLGKRLRRRAFLDEEPSNEDIDRGVEACAAAVEAGAPDDQNYTVWLVELVDSVIARIDSGHARDGDIDWSIALQREVVERPDFPSKSRAQFVLGQRLMARPDRTPADVDEAIDVLALAVSGSDSSTDRAHTAILVALANALGVRVGSEHERPDDSDWLVDVHRRIVEREDLFNRPQTLGICAQHLHARWKRDRDSNAADLDDAIELVEEAVALLADDDSTLVRHLMFLVDLLIDRVRETYERPGDLDSAIELQRRVVAAAPAEERADTRWVLGSHLRLRWSRDRRTYASDLDELIAVFEESLLECRDDATQRTSALLAAASGRLARATSPRAQPDDLASARSHAEAALGVVTVMELPTSLRRMLRQ